MNNVIDIINKYNYNGFNNYEDRCVNCNHLGIIKDSWECKDFNYKCICIVECGTFIKENGLNDSVDTPETVVFQTKG